MAKKREKKLEKLGGTGANMEGASEFAMQGNKPNIKRVSGKHFREQNSDKFPHTAHHPGALGPKVINWATKKKHPRAEGSSGSLNAVGGAFINKEGDGGGDGGGSGLAASGATVFTSTNAGIFTPTHGGNGKKRNVKPKKKRTGIERLGVFLTDGSPQKKMRKGEGFITELQKWVDESKQHLESISKEVFDTYENPPKVVERKGYLESKTDAQQKEIEEKRRTYNPTERSEDGSRMLDLSEDLSKIALGPTAFGNPQDDELKRGSKKDTLDPDWKVNMELDIEKFIKETRESLGLGEYEKEPFLRKSEDNEAARLWKKVNLI